jgi:S1-C subfamily serine protease
MAAESNGLRTARRLVKGLALVLGALPMLLCLMALAGRVVESGWLRLPLALLVMLGLPALIADRLLPDDVDAARGLPSDVFALAWLGFPALFAFGLQTVSRPPPPAPLPSTSSQPAEPRRAEGAGETPAALFKRLAPAVVSVSVGLLAAGETEEMQGGGTGFLIDQNGTIVTNHHVIADAKKVRIKFMSGALFDDVDLLVEDGAADLALLRVALDKPKEGERVKVEPLPLGDSEAILVGERAISIGNPLGLEHTLTDGLISARRVYQGRQWIQTSVPVSPGNSGGPLFDMRGRVIGVTTAQIRGFMGSAQNLNLAVPVNVLKRMLRLEYPGRRKFGSGAGSSHW